MSDRVIVVLDKDDKLLHVLPVNPYEFPRSWADDLRRMAADLGYTVRSETIDVSASMTCIWREHSKLDAGAGETDERH